MRLAVHKARKQLLSLNEQNVLSVLRVSDLRSTKDMREADLPATQSRLDSSEPITKYPTKYQIVRILTIRVV